MLTWKWITAWKVAKYGVKYGPYFPAFELNTEIYRVIHRIKSEYRIIRTRNNSVFGHFSRNVYHLLHLYLIWNAMLCVYICWTLKLVFLLVLKRLHNNVYSDFLKYCTNKSIAYQKEVALIFKEVAWFQQLFHICYSLLKLNQDLAFSLVGKTIYSFPLKTSITYNLDKYNEKYMKIKFNLDDDFPLL